MTHLARLAALIYNRPLLVHPGTAATVTAALGDRFGVEGIDVSAPLPDTSRFRGAATPDSGGRYRVENGTAILTVTGELCNRGAWIGASSGLTSYEGIAAQLRAALADPGVRSILLDVDSPGGEAVGAFECAAAVRAAAGKKPLVALVDGMAASAAYALVSGADRIFVTPSAIVGSIGVVLMHLDQSRALDKKGLTPTLIFAGAHKVDGHSLGPLPEGVKADLQAEVDGFYAMFVETVATNRDLDPDAVRATEARCFMGADAVAARLADAVGTLDAALASLQRHPNQGSNRMDMISMADHQSALATARTETFAAAMAAGKTEGAADLAAARTALSTAKAEATAAERQRIGAILGLDEAKERMTSAQHLALTTDMTAEQVKGTLAGLATAVAPAGQRRMGHVPVPPIAPDARGAEAKAEADHGWGSIVQAGNKAAGFPTR